MAVWDYTEVLALFYNCFIFTYSTVTSRKCEINIIVIVIAIVSTEWVILPYDHAHF